MNQAKKEILTSLKKTQGLLAKLTDMVEKDAYCIDIMQQNLAAIGLLKAVHLKLLQKHLSHCFVEGIQSKDVKKREQVIEEVMKINKLFTK